MELTPEERSKIYAEEKARIEIREKLKRDRPAGIGLTMGVLIFSGFLIVLAIGFAMVLTDDPEALATNGSAPAAEQIRAGCKMTILQLEDKPTSELSISQLKELRFCKTITEDQ